MTSHEIITRKEAIERGLKRYFIGAPCPNGHISIRNTENYTCRKCHRDLIKKRIKNGKLTEKEIASKKEERKRYYKKYEVILSEKRAYERALKHAEQDQETE